VQNPAFEYIYKKHTFKYLEKLEIKNYLQTEQLLPEALGQQLFSSFSTAKQSSQHCLHGESNTFKISILKMQEQAIQTNSSNLFT